MNINLERGGGVSLYKRNQRAKDDYIRFLRLDCGFSFAEWLMIDLRFDCYMDGWRCWNPSRGISGEWKPTKKDAKASYKEALANNRRERK